MSRFFSLREWFDSSIMSRRGSRRTTSGRKPTRLMLEPLEERLAPALSIADAAAVEPPPGGMATVNFTVTRTGPLTAPLTVGYATVAGTAQAGTDFTPKTSSTTFAAGSATATIGIP